MLPGFPRNAALAAVLALSLAGCKSKDERTSDRLMPFVTALSAKVPKADPKEFVRTATGYLDTITALEESARALERPPVGTKAAAELAPSEKWIEAARAEHAALEKTFRDALAGTEIDVQRDVGKVVFGAATKSLDDLPATLAPYHDRPFVLWRGTGDKGGFDVDYQNLPAARRALDPGKRFIVGYVQRTEGEAVNYVTEKVTAERKVAIVALYDIPTRRKLGVYTIVGDAAKLPKPTPPEHTVLPGEKPPLVENLLKAP